MKVRWTSSEIRRFCKDEVREMKYIVSHSKHSVTHLGSAPNETTNQQQLQQRANYESHGSVGVLRF